MSRVNVKEEILVAFTGNSGGPGALGNIWRITAKRTKGDFYVDLPPRPEELFHLSVHGPNNEHPDGHRFQFKVNGEAVAAVKDRGDFIVHSVPLRRGQPFDGQQLAPGVFRVARVRWTWDLQRPRFYRAASTGPAPDISDNQSGRGFGQQLEPNEAVDLVLVVSYEEAIWPGGRGSLRDNARLGPLRNGAGMWLTGTLYRRPQKKYPTPQQLIYPHPGPSEEPNRALSAGPIEDQAGVMYWFVESITSRQFLEVARTGATPPA